MARDLRLLRRGALYHVTNRCYRGELRLTPDEAVILFASGCLAEAARRYGVRIITFIFMGNHFHLIVQTPYANLNAFMMYFQRELSTRLNRYRGQSETNFPKRYRHEEILSEADFERLVARMLCNPVRARLVYDASDWPGFSSLMMHRSGESSTTVRHATRDQAAEMGTSSASDELLRSLNPVQLELAPPPFWAELDSSEVQSRIAALIDAEETRLQSEIDRHRQRVRGRNRVLDETPDRHPDQVHWRAYRRCLSENGKTEAAFHAYYRRTRRQYTRARQVWLETGDWHQFPPGSFPPGRMRCIPPSGTAGPPIPWRVHIRAA